MDLKTAEQVMGAINNWFLRRRHVGRFEIADGTLRGLSLREGQLFRVMGSTFNEGLHQAPEEMKDEEFEGEVWELALPASFSALIEDIETWSAAHPAGSSGYTSESFGGYSYSLPTDSNGAAVSWDGVFASRLNQFRRMPCS